jgi:hypothetical protein
MHRDIVLTPSLRGLYSFDATGVEVGHAMRGVKVLMYSCSGH